MSFSGSVNGASKKYFLILGFASVNGPYEGFWTTLYIV